MCIDPGERFNVADQHPEVARYLQSVVEEARRDLVDDMTKNPGLNRRPA